MKGERIGFYLESTQPLLESCSNLNDIQLMLMHIKKRIVVSLLNLTLCTTLYKKCKLG